MMLCLQTLICLFIWQREKSPLDHLTRWLPFFRVVAVVLGVSMAIWAGISWSRIGLEPDRSGWYSPGTPLLFSQVALTCMVGIGFLMWESSIESWISKVKQKAGSLINLDVLLCVVLWVGAFLIWWNEPMRKWSYFSSEPTPPNYEFYPYSDAAIYDEASQGLLVGISRSASVMLRPLYSFFLALLHTLGGQDYQAIVLIQVLVLAIIPALVYLIGSKLGNRAAGIIAALLAILREKNSIALTNVIEVSHSKLLLSDTPAFALMLLFVFLLVTWLQRPESRDPRGILAGAALGMVVLVRSQAQLLVPVVLICLIFAGRIEWGSIFRKFLLFMIGLILLIAPWIWRNYQISGNAAVENPEFYIRILASGYVHSEDEYEPLPGEGFDDYYARMKAQIVDFILENPGEVARFYTSHFVHNEIGSIVYLPLSLKLYPLRSYVDRLGFWADPSKILSGGAATLLLINLGLISIGIAAAYRRAKWIGLMPLFVHLGYSLSVVPMRLSGWRFILPVDWVPMLYYSFGLMILCAVILSFFNKKWMPPLLDKSPEVDAPQQIVRSGHGSISFALIVSALFGLTLPLIELLTPVRYPELRQDEIIRRFISEEVHLSDGVLLPRSDLSSFLETQKGAVVLYGRALYPGFYKAGEYWGDDNAFLLTAREYDRLQFRLIGPVPGSVFIPLTQPPASFPHASDVVVIGCSSGYGIKALVVQVKDQAAALSASPWPGLTCPASN
jgi:hypothetical protein